MVCSLEPLHLHYQKMHLRELTVKWILLTQLWIGVSRACPFHCCLLARAEHSRDLIELPLGLLVRCSRLLCVLGDVLHEGG